MLLDAIRVVLIEPSHPGNIGAVARAMKTMSLDRLVLVRPRVFPSPDADRRAMGAIDILQRAEVVDDLEEAIGDCKLVVGGSARERTIPHSVLDARQCGVEIVEAASRGESVALLFGPERAGLANQDLDHCKYQVLIPTSDEFSSLNLASAVQLVCYEIFIAARERESMPAVSTDSKRLAPGEEMPVHSDMEYFFGHLERALDTRGYLDGEMREVTLVKFRRMVGRARPNAGELGLLHSLVRLIRRDGSQVL